ncbi:Anaphase-promoting complex subunit 4 [Podila clonocystis]|nr:Anaphase-promoting complex subunit 4 [Podila clonocystis]
MVSLENDLEMYRLSWEKHWSIRVKAHPKPGGASRLSAGKMIAVGLGSGHINIYDYMDGSLAHTIAPVALENNPMASIQCLKWTEVYLGPSPPPAFFGIRQSPKTLLDAMPLLSPIPESSTQQEMSARMMFAKHRRGAAARGGFGGAARTAGTVHGLSKPEDVTVLDEESSPIMNALFSSDSHGRFRLRLFGGFDMKSISLKDMLQEFAPHQFQTIDILAADIQADLSELAIVALGSTSEEKSTEGQLLQITVDSGLLRGHAREIRAMGVRTRPVQHLLTYMDECLEVMRKDYGKLSQLAENSAESLKDCLKTNGESKDPSAEFSQLLLTGRPSVSMDQYLQQELGHHGVKRWDKSGKAAYENMRKVAFECLLPACERLVVHMTDILAYSRWRERYGPLDLDESNVYSCIRLAGDFIGMIERLFQALKVEIKQFHEFENWLEQEGHLMQLTRQCHLVFEGPTLALAQSFKVQHLLNLTPLDPVPLSSNAQAQDTIKVSLRYCYQDLEPWLYVALYLPSSRANKEPHLCVLRSRKSEQPSPETPHSSEQNRILLNPFETGSGRKRKSSDESVDSRKEPRTGASLFSPRTVSKEFSTLSLASTSCMGLNTTDATRVEMNLARYTEALLFSLRPDGLPPSEGHEVEGYQEPPKWVDIRDIVFRDHDSLALLLSSSDADQHEYMDQQYLVLMPLEPHKYTPDVVSDATGATLLDRLTVTNLSSEILALPIRMSRNVTQPSMMDTSFVSLSSTSHGIPDDTLGCRANTLVGPCRIACNERGKSQVLSIHGPQPGAQGAGRITIFDL